MNRTKTVARGRARVARGSDPAATSGSRGDASSRAQPVLPAPPLPLFHPAVLVAALACAASVVLSVAYQISDADHWQLLVVGKALWLRHASPATDEWTWVGFGDPQVTSSWGFRALIWTLWSGLGIVGLFLYRWAATLAAFGLM